MAATAEMQSIAIKVKPDYCCIVPERREELTPEGGLDVLGHLSRMRDLVTALSEHDIQVSLFIEANKKVIDAAAEIAAPIIELHTGHYADLPEEHRAEELQRIDEATQHALQLGLIVNAGHGLNVSNVREIAVIPGMNELNIGHSIIADALFMGLEGAILRMRAAMDGEV